MVVNLSKKILSKNKKKKRIKDEIKKLIQKALIASTVALAVIPFTKATAETLEDWVARSVDEIKHDIQQSGENQQTYTIKYGDTLSSIAEALGIDVHVLANLKQHQQHGFDLPRYCIENNSK